MLHPRSELGRFLVTMFTVSINRRLGTWWIYEWNYSAAVVITSFVTLVLDKSRVGHLRYAAWGSRRTSRRRRHCRREHRFQNQHHDSAIGHDLYMLLPGNLLYWYWFTLIYLRNNKTLLFMVYNALYDVTIKILLVYFFQILLLFLSRYVSI